MPQDGTNSSEVEKRLVGEDVVEVIIDAPDAQEVVTVEEGQVKIKLTEGVPYGQYRESYTDGILSFKSLIEHSTETEKDLVRTWRDVYHDNKARGKIVLRSLAANGTREGEHLRVSYEDLEGALDEHGYDVSAQTLAGVFRGVNASIARTFPQMEKAGDAQQILYQERDDDGNRFRLLSKGPDGEDHPEALRDALRSLGVISAN